MNGTEYNSVRTEKVRFSEGSKLAGSLDFFLDAPIMELKEIIKILSMLVFY